MSAAPRSPEMKWCVKNEPPISRDSSATSSAALDVSSASPVLASIVGQPDLERGPCGATLRREQRAALAAIDERDAHIGTRGGEPAAELGERQPIATELERLAVGVAREVEQDDDPVRRILTKLGDPPLRQRERLGERRDGLALEQEQVVGRDAAELGEHACELARVGLGVAQRRLIRSCPRCCRR